MFNMSFGEMAIIGIIALIFIGPKELPGVARTVGKLINELKRASEDFTSSFVKARDNFDAQARNFENSISQIDQNQSQNQNEPEKSSLQSGDEISTENKDPKGTT